MRAPLALLAVTAALSRCADLTPLSALAGANRRDQTVVVAHSTGGGVFATAADLGRIWKAGGTDDATFLFHAAHINGRLHSGQTEHNFTALPAAIRALLPPPASWRVNLWHAVGGGAAHDALGRGHCTEGTA